MLEEEVIFTFVIQQSVGVVHPITNRGEVKLWAIFLIARLASWMRYHGGYLILAV
jgi:hypothetical protein